MVDQASVILLVSEWLYYSTSYHLDFFCLYTNYYTKISKIKQSRNFMYTTSNGHLMMKYDNAT